MDIHDEIIQELKEILEETWNDYNNAKKFIPTYISDVVEAQSNLAEALRNRDDIRRLS